MCKSSKKTESSNSSSNTNSSATTSVPEYVTDATTRLASAGTDILNRPFESYTAPRVADFTPDQQSAFQALRNLIANSPTVAPGAIESAREYGNAPAQTVSTERVVDQNGRLGAISDYLNPYQNSVVDPALRRIQEQADKQNKNINSMATASKAFGDARHGIMEAMLGRDTSLAMGETSGNLMKQGYDTAMNERTADLNRFRDIDALNANFNETALNRKLASGRAQVDLANADQNRLLTQINALLGTGSQQQSNDQSRLDASYQEFMRRYLGDDQSRIAAATQALSGIKGNYNTNVQGNTQGTTEGTKTTRQPDNSILGALGSGAGSVLGSNGFWNWLASTAPAAGGVAVGGV